MSPNGHPRTPTPPSTTSSNVADTSRTIGALLSATANNSPVHSTGGVLEDDAEGEEDVELQERGGGEASGTTADDHQIMAILAHMSQQQSTNKPVAASASASTSTDHVSHSPPPPRPSLPPSHPLYTHHPPPPLIGSGRQTSPPTILAPFQPQSQPTRTLPGTTTTTGNGTPSGVGSRSRVQSRAGSVETEGGGGGGATGGVGRGRKGRGKASVNAGGGEGGGEDGSATPGGGTPGPAGGETDWTRTRKDNHKEVERRRRETINEGINELKKIVPGCEKNKGSILQRAVQYIQQLKDEEVRNIERWTLEKLLSDQACSELRGMVEKERKRLGDVERECERLREEVRRLGGGSVGAGGAGGVKRAGEGEREESGKRVMLEGKNGGV